MVVEVSRYVMNRRGDYEPSRQIINTNEVESAHRDHDPPRGMGYAGQPVTKVRTRSGDEFWISGDIDQLIPDDDE